MRLMHSHCTQSNVINSAAWVFSFRIQYKNAKPKHQGWALLEMLHTLFSSEEVGGLLQTLQTGTFKEQEAASAALWHMSAMQPQKKAVLLANSSSLAFLQNIAENEDNAADVAAAKGMHSLEPSRENGVSERKFSFTEVTRRNCLNVLKMLGRVPMEVRFIIEALVIENNIYNVFPGTWTCSKHVLSCIVRISSTW
jgi:hypothetical protein